MILPTAVRDTSRNNTLGMWTSHTGAYSSLMCAGRTFPRGIICQCKARLILPDVSLLAKVIFISFADLGDVYRYSKAI